jgi:hypothetical protein
MNEITERLSAIRGLQPSQLVTTAAKSINKLAKGGYIEIDGQTYLVSEVSKYLDVKWKSFKKRKNDYWVTELLLFNLLTGEKKYIEWEIDDELEMSQTLAQIKIKDIAYEGRPITRSNLEEIAEEENGAIRFDGETFDYIEDDTWAALYHAEKFEEPLQVRMYEFSSDSGKNLTIELWENEESKPEREAFISREINLKLVFILQSKGGDQITARGENES